MFALFVLVIVVVTIIITVAVITVTVIMTSNNEDNNNNNYTNKPVYDTYKPPGFYSITPYLTTSNAVALVDFLTQAFDAVELHRTTTEDGVVVNVILRIGDACFMIGQAAAAADAFVREYHRCGAQQFLLYVDNPDQVHARALQYGATDAMAVQDRPYGDRMGGIQDPVAGMKWWITKRLQKEPY